MGARAAHTAHGDGDHSAHIGCQWLDNHGQYVNESLTMKRLPASRVRGSGPLTGLAAMDRPMPWLPACRRKLIPGFKRKSFKAESLEVRQQNSKMDATMTDFHEWFPT